MRSSPAFSKAHGIALSTSERISGLKAAHIEGSDTTLQLTFPSEVPEKGFTLSLARGEGEHAGDVTWNGERVSESVSAPQGAAAAWRRAPVTTATVVSSKAQEQQRRPEQAASALHGSNQQPQGGRAVAGATEAPAGGLGASLPPVVQDLAVLHHIPRGRGGTRTLPDDAMLILSQDLYLCVQATSGATRRTSGAEHLCTATLTQHTLADGSHRRPACARLDAGQAYMIWLPRMHWPVYTQGRSPP